MASLTLIGVSGGRAHPSPDYAREFHSAVPLGAERIDLRPSGRTLYFLATAESPLFEGWRAYDDGEHRFLQASDGRPAQNYPRTIQFRITATAMRPDMMMVDPYGTLHLSDGDINAYLLNLSFRMLIFHGLQITSVEPEALRGIGMPSEIPYFERVFQVEFTLPKSVPVSDRVVLEVLSPTRARLCKFHLDFF